MPRRSFYVVNAITMYRLLAASFLTALIIYGHLELFKWLLALSFFTDAIDGFLARRFKVASVFGSKLDSIADDFTMAVAIAGAIVFKPELLRQELTVIIILLALFVIQVVAALVRYKRLTSFHTYAAKVATILQGIFFILLFFLPSPLYPLFYAAVIATAIDLIEEIIMVLMLPAWKADVKGLYWAWKEKPVSSS